MYKIKSITLRNFKFFYGDESFNAHNKINLYQNNLLLYGENGSGKSTIYWALYTFLQSCLKNRGQVDKYFDHTKSENLRSRFAADTDIADIIVEFEDETGRTLSHVIGNSNVSTLTGTFIRKSLDTSDFLNYRYLSQLYNFRNSQEIDLFPLFEREILMFIDFGEQFKLHNGDLSGSSNGADWWKFIAKEHETLPLNKRTVSVSSEAYKQYKGQTIPKFITLLKIFLQKITQSANEYLQNEFKENINIFFDLDAIECDFNKKVSTRAKDGILHRPKIPLRVKDNHLKIDAAKQEIIRPHIFLNEARLTAISLSIRLAILDEKYFNDELARLLVVDDLLLSLDMNHRDVVLDILLKKADKYQLLILTHDRGFYNVCKRRIETQFSSGWVFKELYRDEKEGIPVPFMPDKRNYLDLAIKHLKMFDYPASANYMRKECERLLKNLLPENRSKIIKENGTAYAQLDTLIEKFLEYYKELGCDCTPFLRLKEYKDLIMNPMSHDNIHSPLYRKELEKLKQILVKLNKLKSVKLVDMKTESDLMIELVETDENGEQWKFFLKANEDILALQNLNGDWKLSNPKCHFIGRTNESSNKQSEIISKQKDVKINKGYERIMHSLKIKGVNAPKDLMQIISKNGQTIEMILTRC